MKRKNENLNILCELEMWNTRIAVQTCRQSIFKFNLFYTVTRQINSIQYPKSSNFFKTHLQVPVNLEKREN